VNDYAHSDSAEARRADKTVRLARFAWDRGISGTELLGLDSAARRRLARTAEANPPSTDETWAAVARLLDDKDAWATRNPDHPAAARMHPDEKLMWVKPPVKPW
jgi:hypothetical protein